VLTSDHTVLPATYTFIHEWNEPSCLYSVSIHQMAPPERGSAHPITAHYSFIDLERMKGWVHRCTRHNYHTSSMQCRACYQQTSVQPVLGLGHVNWTVTVINQRRLPPMSLTSTRTIMDASHRDMTGAHQNLNGSRHLTTPLSGMICHPWARTCYDQPAYQIWKLYLRPLQKYVKGYKMWKMG